MFASTKLLSANSIGSSSSLFHNTIPLTLFRVFVSPVSKSRPSWLSVIVASYKMFEFDFDYSIWFISTSTASDRPSSKLAATSFRSSFWIRFNCNNAESKLQLSKNAIILTSCGSICSVDNLKKEYHKYRYFSIDTKGQDCIKRYESSKELIT